MPAKTWVSDEAPHVECFEQRCVEQGINIKKVAPGEYVDPQTGLLWSFYTAGACQENSKWMDDY